MFISKKMTIQGITSEQMQGIITKVKKAYTLLEVEIMAEEVSQEELNAARAELFTVIVELHFYLGRLEGMEYLEENFPRHRSPSRW